LNDDPSDPIEAALRGGDDFDTCLKHLRRAAAEGERLAQGPGGKFFNGIRLADFRSNLNQAVNALAATRPTHRCGGCRGAGSERCGGCRGAGCERCEQAGCRPKRRPPLPRKSLSDAGSGVVAGVATPPRRR
jgi:hypothetical protein